MAKVLIVEGNEPLGRLWQRHLQRHGMNARLVTAQAEAEAAVREQPYDVIILNLMLRAGSAFLIADLANEVSPQTRVIFVTDTSFFSDGSIFALCPNACAHLQSDTSPDDLVAMVEHYGRRPA